MPANDLESLPLDIFYTVASTLDPESFISLSELTILSTYAKYTKEAELARHQSARSITYRQALTRVSDVRKAYKTARPYSCSILGYGAAFLYKKGILCYLESNQVRILQLHDWSRDEQVIDIRSLIDHKTSNSTNHENAQLTLLHYQDNILSFLYETDNSHGRSWLVAIDRRIAAPKCPVKLFRRLRATAKLFVRQNDSYLYFGTHTGTNNDHPHKEWVIEGVNLETRESFEPVQLDRFVGSDLGLTVCFEIFNGFFYALSNQTSFDVEEIDWTSNYTCLRFPVGDPSALERNDKIWRRQHIEGPINDTWTDLSLHLDEMTNKVVIVECRREWTGGGSVSRRTFYNEPLPFGEDSESVSAALGQAMYPDDILTTQIDETNKPNYTPAQPRPQARFHPEYPSNASVPREFILAKTKHRTYNLSCSAFLDLVNDPQNTPFAAPRDRLRLRIGHRKLGSPMVLDQRGRYVLREEEEYHDQGIRMWPDDDAPKELFELLCPNRTIGQVNAASDERSVVYMTGPSSSNTRAIVIINFDRMVNEILKWKDCPLKRLYARDRPAPASDADGQMLEVEVERMRCGEVRGEQRPVSMDPVSASLSKTPSSTPVPYFRNERAKYLDIRKGYWLR